MTTLNRRSLIATATASVAAIALSGCATTKAGTTTTTTINVDKIKSYLTAALNGAATILLIVDQVPSLADKAAPLTAIVTELTDASNQFDETAGDQVTVDYTNTSVRTMVGSIFNILQKLTIFIGTLIKVLMSSNTTLPANGLSRMRLIYSALSTLISVLKTIVYPSYASLDGDPYHPVETKALAVLNA